MESVETEESSDSASAYVGCCAVGFSCQDVVVQFFISVDSRILKGGNAGERTRTSMGITPPDPKSGASANFATPAALLSARMIRS